VPIIEGGCVIALGTLRLLRTLSKVKSMKNENSKTSTSNFFKTSTSEKLREGLRGIQSMSTVDSDWVFFYPVLHYFCSEVREVTGQRCLGFGVTGHVSSEANYFVKPLQHTRLSIPLSVNTMLTPIVVLAKPRSMEIEG
jgi:hypothetical protein